MRMSPQALLFQFLLLFFLYKLHSHGDGALEVFAAASPQQIFSPQNHQKVFSVDDFGARGEGGDDREAFMKAWKGACSSNAPATFLVPKKKKYILKPLKFNGPCNSKITVMITGTVEASPNRSDWADDDTSHWILFNKVNNLAVGGGGAVNGNGETWWKSSCKVNPNLPCTVAPTALTFYSCSQLKVENLSITDSQQIHVSVEQSTNVSISNLSISAPESSPNTDGIHVSNTKNMLIKHSSIKTGDDCISIVSGSKNVRVSDVECGPGHGISIGSLGGKKSREKVSDVVVDTVTLNGTTNGVRIKTWQGGQGHARDIIFQNIVMQNVYNPIIIDQSYCDSPYPCNEEKSAVSISRVTYRNIKGTSASKVAISFSCSKTLPCQNIKMEDIRLVGEEGGSTESLCENANLELSEMVHPACA